MCVCHRNHNYFIKVHPYVHTLTCMLMYVCMFVFMCACGYETQRSITNKPRTCAWCAVGSGVRRATKKPFGRSVFFKKNFCIRPDRALPHPAFDTNAFAKTPAKRRQTTTYTKRQQSRIFAIQPAIMKHYLMRSRELAHIRDID